VALRPGLNTKLRIWKINTVVMTVLHTPKFWRDVDPHGNYLPELKPRNGSTALGSGRKMIATMSLALTPIFIKSGSVLGTDGLRTGATMLMLSDVSPVKLSSLVFMMVL